MLRPLFLGFAISLASVIRAQILLGGNAAQFAVLAGQALTNTGPTIITTGNIGVSPGSAISGFPPGSVAQGTIEVTTALAMRAQSDALIAFNTAAALPPGTILGPNLGGLTLAAGVYSFGSAATIIGTLTLDGQNDPNAFWVFQIPSTLITGPGATVALINGASSCNIFWQVGSSATLDTSTVFVGIIVASTSITVNNGVTLLGDAFALTGAVTLINDNISGLINCPTLSATTSTSTSSTTPASIVPIFTNTSPTPNVFTTLATSITAIPISPTSTIQTVLTLSTELTASTAFTTFATTSLISPMSPMSVMSTTSSISSITPIFTASTVSIISPATTIQTVSTLSTELTVSTAFATVTTTSLISPMSPMSTISTTVSSITPTFTAFTLSTTSTLSTIYPSFATTSPTSPTSSTSSTSTASTLPMTTSTINASGSATSNLTVWSSFSTSTVTSMKATTTSSAYSTLSTNGTGCVIVSTSTPTSTPCPDFVFTTYCPDAPTVISTRKQTFYIKTTGTYTLTCSGRSLSTEVDAMEIAESTAACLSCSQQTTTATGSNPTSEIAKEQNQQTKTDSGGATGTSEVRHATDESSLTASSTTSAVTPEVFPSIFTGSANLLKLSFVSSTACALIALVLVL